MNSRNGVSAKAWARFGRSSVRSGSRKRERNRRRTGSLAGLVLIGLGLLLGACSPHGRAAVRPGRTESVMVASWYGPKYHGRATASGEVFDMNRHTAAHRTLPFGSRLRVTHPVTDKSVEVTVNDRGPFIRGRDLDLSYGAAQSLGMVDEGVARVLVERLN